VNTYIFFLFLGLGAGALYAVLGQGLVLAYRGSGVINLSHGAIALYAAYTFTGLRNGQLMMPPLPNPLTITNGIAGWFGAHPNLPAIPTLINIGGPMNVWVALVVASVISALLGWVLHVLVFRPLRKAPPLGKSVASVGVLLVLQAIVVLRFGTQSLSVQPFLPQHGISIAGGKVPADRFILTGFAIVTALLLWAAGRFTRWGMASRAAAENEEGAMLIGLSPNRLASVNWIVSALIAGAAGILFSSITGLDPTGFVLFVIPALGAALLARFESFTIVTIAGLALGAAESIATLLQQDYSWFPQTGAAAGLPFLVIIVTMVVRGKPLPDRGLSAAIRLPASPEPRRIVIPGAIFVVLTFLGLVYLPYTLRGAIMNSLIGVILALSLVVVVGFAGQISLMQMAIAGLAALAMTRVAGQWNWPFPLGPIVAILVAGIFGVLVGLPAVRVRGVNLAIVTLGAAYAFEQMVLDNGSVLRTQDATDVVSPHVFGFNLGVDGSFPFGQTGPPSAWFGLLTLVVALAVMLIVVALRKGPLGRQWLAIRTDERAAASLGVNVAASKLLAFAIGAAFAGAAGVLTAYQFQGVTSDQFVAMMSVSILAVAYLGGISTISGAVIAGTLVVGGVGFALIDEVVNLGQYEPLIAGLGLVITAILNPEGISGVMRATAKSVRLRLDRFIPVGRAGDGGGAGAVVAAGDGSSEPTMPTGQLATSPVDVPLPHGQ
jgi:branched-chain amino acid transport system permease protein